MNDAADQLPVIAILGGTGDLGTGLAHRWAQVGYDIVIGSRTVDKARAAVDDGLMTMADRGAEVAAIRGMQNTDAARMAGIVALTVQFGHHATTLESVKPTLEGKILIDVTVPFVPPKVARVQLPDEGSAGQIAQNTLGRMFAWYPRSGM